MATKNQIDYWTLKEAVLHNRITEAQTAAALRETQKHNRADESIRSTSNTINRDHYVRQDSINDAHYSRMDTETAKHNRATEEQAKGELAEAILSHRNTEAINSVSAAADTANALTNARNAATNERNAAINAMNAATNARNADTNAKNASTAEFNAVTSRQEALGQLERWAYQNKSEEINYSKLESEIRKIDSESLRNQAETALTNLKAAEQEYQNDQMVTEQRIKYLSQLFDIWYKWSSKSGQEIGTLFSGFFRALGGAKNITIE